MRFRDAKDLHNGDEVTIKETGAVVTVCNTSVHDKVVEIDCFCDGITAFTHKEVK